MLIKEKYDRFYQENEIFDFLSLIIRPLSTIVVLTHVSTIIIIIFIFIIRANLEFLHHLDQQQQQSDLSLLLFTLRPLFRPNLEMIDMQQILPEEMLQELLSLPDETIITIFLFVGLHGSISFDTALVNRLLRISWLPLKRRIFHLLGIGLYEKTFVGHILPINCMIQLFDGRIVTGSVADIKIWDQNSGGCTIAFQGHSRDVLELIEIENGQLVSCSSDSTIAVWNTNTGEQVWSFTEHTGVVSVLLKLMDGRLASGSWDGTVKIWNIISGHCEMTLQNHPMGVYALAQLMDGRVVSSGLDTTINVWNLTSCTCELTLSEQFGKLQHILEMKDGRIASASDENSIKIWNTSSGLCEMTISEPFSSLVCAVRLSDGNIASSNNFGQVTVWDVNTGTPLVRFLANRGRCDYDRFCMLQLTDGRLVSGSTDQHVKIWNVNSGLCEMTLVGNYDSIRCLF